jgi:hypothetical protein
VPSGLDINRLIPLLLAYNGALMKCFEVAIGMACLSLVGAAFVEWKSVKGQELGAAGA